MIPITILTGFLWAGKTTLLNHILRNADGRKIAVIENEYGSAGIDADLIERTTEEVIEISDGCMCCTVRKDFIEAIERLLASGRPIDSIIIECSGMSDPLPIAQSFLMNDMGWRVRLDSIICVVDALNFEHRVVQNTDTALDQIEYADFIIVNKRDLITENQMSLIMNIVRRVNAWAPIIEATEGVVSLDLLLDTARIDETLSEKLASTPDDHTHDSSLTSYSAKITGTLDGQKLDTFFQELPEDIYRVKGFVHLKEQKGRKLILQKAGARMTLTDGGEATDEVNTLVFIGKGIHPLQINIELSKCLLTSRK